ncbi:MAG: hypothetical protein DCC57_14470, partial [Chloroflexi bacterium]
ATVELVNTSPSQARELLIQAGAFGEHTITRAEIVSGAAGDTAPQAVEVQNRHLQVALPAGRSVVLRLTMDRYSNTPSYTQPV